MSNPGPPKLKIVRGWMPAEEKVLREMIMGGASAEEIGAKLGRTEAGVRSFVARNGISLKRR